MELCERVLRCVDQDLPEGSRKYSRHFWFSDQFQPYERRYLRDVGSTVNVTLELRPDFYQVRLPGRDPDQFAIDPELASAIVVDRLMGDGASRCYRLVPSGGQPIEDAHTLYERDLLPFHARLSQQERVVDVKRKPHFVVSALIILALSALMGLILGIAFGHIVNR
jgi:hypothetical protein